MPKSINSDRFPCSYENCNKSFAQKSGLNRHVQTEHLKKKYKCSICEATFTQKTNLKDHENAHTNYGVPAYTCRFCDYGFNDKKSCVRHEKQQHGENKQCSYFCPVNGCDFTYRRLDLMKRHLSSGISKKLGGHGLNPDDLQLQLFWKNKRAFWDPSSELTVARSAGSTSSYSNQNGCCQYPCIMRDCSAVFSVLSEAEEHIKHEHGVVNQLFDLTKACPESTPSSYNARSAFSRISSATHGGSKTGEGCSLPSTRIAVNQSGEQHLVKPIQGDKSLISGAHEHYKGEGSQQRYSESCIRSSDTPSAFPGGYSVPDPSITTLYQRFSTRPSLGDQVGVPQNPQQIYGFSSFSGVGSYRPISLRRATSRGTSSGPSYYGLDSNHQIEEAQVNISGIQRSTRNDQQSSSIDLGRNFFPEYQLSRTMSASNLVSESSAAPFGQEINMLRNMNYSPSSVSGTNSPQSRSSSSLSLSSTSISSSLSSDYPVNGLLDGTDLQIYKNYNITCNSSAHPNTGKPFNL